MILLHFFCRFYKTRNKDGYPGSLEFMCGSVSAKGTMNVLAFSLLLSMPTHDVNDLKKVVDIF